MDINRSGSAPSTTGPEEYFTGTVRIDPLFRAEPPGRAVGAQVTFEPGARTAWHTHPAGQTLIVTFGKGRVQLLRDLGGHGGVIHEDRAALHPGKRAVLAESTGLTHRPPSASVWPKWRTNSL